MEWGISWFLGRCCFVAATLASSASGDNVGDDNIWGVVLWGMWCKWKSFIVNWDLDNRLFIINWDHDCFVVDVDGVRGSSRSPGGPVILDVKVSTLDKGSKEVELIVVGVHLDKDDAIIGAQGEDGRGGESCAREFVVD